LHNAKTKAITNYDHARRQEMSIHNELAKKRCFQRTRQELDF